MLNVVAFLFVSVSLVAFPHSLTAETSVAAYDFDAGGGVAVTDRSGNNHSGTLVNGPTWTSGKHGGGLAFDGSNDYVTMGDIARADSLSSFTVSAWVRFAVNGGGAVETHLIDKSHCSGHTNGGPWELGVSLSSPHKAEFLIYPQGGNPSRIIFSGASTTSIDDGAWHYITGSYDGTRLSIWVDGNEENSVPLPGVTITNTSYHMELGGHCNGYSYLFKGTLDDVRVYTRALTRQEILTDMGTPVGSGASPPPPPAPPPPAPPPPAPGQDITAPSVPGGLSASGVTPSRITLAWQASTDNVAVTGYRVYRDGTLVRTTSSTTTTNTGLAPNTSYVFTVAAFDAAGNTSAHSTALTVNTSATSSPPSGSYSTSFDSNENPISEGGVWRRLITLGRTCRPLEASHSGPTA